MKIFGMALIFFSAVLFSYQRNRRLEERVAVLEELYGFIRQIRIDIGCYLKPIGEIRSASPRLFKLGFFSDIEKYGAEEAYERLEKKLLLAEKEREVLKRFFSSLGKGYAEDEIKLADTALTELSDILKGKKEETPKEKKLTLTLSLSASLALIILLV